MPTAAYDPATGQLLGAKRSFLAIYNDLAALTSGQKAAVWAALTAGSPPLWATDDGPDAGAVAALSVAAIDLTGLSAGVQTAARMKMVAAYVRDNPLWLVAPTFDPTVNVPGYTAA